MVFVTGIDHGKEDPEKRKIPTLPFDSRFVGSFFTLSQLPKDRWPRIAVTGRSNVGKSTLLNSLLGKKKLAKVSSTPGKTRSLNFYAVNEKFYLVDLPGYGYAKAPRAERNAWSRLVQEYLTADSQLKGLLLLLDCRRELSNEDNQMLEWLATKETPVMLVLTKTDKISRAAAMQKSSALEKSLGASVISFSAASGEGKRELTLAIRDLLKNDRHSGKEN